MFFYSLLMLFVWFIGIRLIMDKAHEDILYAEDDEEVKVITQQYNTNAKSWALLGIAMFALILLVKILTLL